MVCRDVKLKESKGYFEIYNCGPVPAPRRPNYWLLDAV